MAQKEEKKREKTYAKVERKKIKIIKRILQDEWKGQAKKKNFQMNKFEKNEENTVGNMHRYTKE